MLDVLVESYIFTGKASSYLAFRTILLTHWPHSSAVRLMFRTGHTLVLLGFCETFCNHLRKFCQQLQCQPEGLVKHPQGACSTNVEQSGE